MLADIASANAGERNRALARVVGANRTPVYNYVRQRWRRPHDDAKHLTQGFFTAALDKEYLAAFDPAKARFRTFLRVCVDRWVQNAATADKALKRGGQAHFELDFESAEHELIDSGGIDDVEQWFTREWARSIFAGAVEELKKRSADQPLGVTRLALFQKYDLVDPGERPSYAALAHEHAIKTTDATNHLAAVRRELRSVVLDTLRELTANDEEYRSEARALLGVDAA